MLLWHQHLSHVNMAWIKTLMPDRKWRADNNSVAFLHSGPFIVSKDNPSWDTAAKGPFQTEFLQAMHVELNTLVN